MFFTHFQIHTIPHSFLFILFLLHPPISLTSDDRQSLLELKSSLDKSNTLQWGDPNPCNWNEIKQCSAEGKVTKLVIEHSNLTGFLKSNLLSPLNQLRLLSLKSNSITGPIPDLSHLTNLKSLFLNNNNLSGPIPFTLSFLHRLKILVLSGNRITGHLPPSLLNLTRLHTLYLEQNMLFGEVPPLNQTSLTLLNLSCNNLSGPIPSTVALLRFNLSSFSGNPRLCDMQIHVECRPANSSFLAADSGSRSLRVRRAMGVAAGVLGGVAMVSVCMAFGCLVVRGRRVRAGGREGGVGVCEAAIDGGVVEGAVMAADGCGGGGEEEGEVGKLVFFDGGGYGMEELMKASAEAMGRGRLGSTYKAAMESGVVVTVKRLRAVAGRVGGEDELGRWVELLGRMNHPNLVRLRAYFHSKEECLLVLDYFPNGSLFSLIHGVGDQQVGKPLHWTSCLKISEDTAAALIHIHNHTPGLAHGNLKSSNILFGPDFESCLTDYGLAQLADRSTSLEESGSVIPAHWAPESQRAGWPVCTPAADVYSFGILLLELLTGRTPPADLLRGRDGGVLIWAEAVREEECDSSSGNGDHQGKIETLLRVASACLRPVPEDRPSIGEVGRMIREIRAEVPHVSSNSSDHSPGRWSDTVHSLPREDHLSI